MSSDDQAAGGESRRFTSLLDILHQRATEQPNDRAYVYLSDRGAEEVVLTFGEIARRATTLALQITGRTQPGDRVLLVFPPGLEFIVGFFACLLAGTIAVPMMPPRRIGARDASGAIAANCEPRLILTTTGLLHARPDLIERYRGLGIDWIATDAAGATASADRPIAVRSAGDLAFLQYTSGSTSAPKGVMVTQGNLLANLEMIRHQLGNARQSTYVSWAPLYHDMGLILSCLETFYLGAPCVLIAPATFMQRPLMWLRAIGRYGAEVACAPNFAYDLCVDRFRTDQMRGVDLSGWKVALNGAEPVRAATLDRFATMFAPYGFAARAFYPAYGMAEATLLVSGGTRGAGDLRFMAGREALRSGAAVRSNAVDDMVLVGCGKSVSGGRIAIVDLDMHRRLAPHRVGEIWVAGPHVAAGYWGKPEATAAAFKAQLEGEEGHWLRTGDLGFLDEDGELYVTGRHKDLIIIRGRNHHPHDIESAVQNSHPALRRHGGAAFAVTDESGAEKVVVVQEVERTLRHEASIVEIEACMREAVADEHDVSIAEIVLIRPGALPKTTSGKIQRSLTMLLWRQGALEIWASSAAAT